MVLSYFCATNRILFLFIKAPAILVLERWQMSHGGAWKYLSLRREGLYSFKDFYTLSVATVSTVQWGRDKPEIRSSGFMPWLSHFLAVPSWTNQPLCASVYSSLKWGGSQSPRVQEGHMS